MKKILFVTHWYPTTLEPARGAFVKEFAKAAMLYNKVYVIAFIGWTKKGTKVISIDNFEEEGIHVYTFKIKNILLPFLGTAIYYYCILKIYRIIARGRYIPDVIHAHVYTAGLGAVILGRLTKTPVVVSEHSTVFVRGRLAIKERLKAKLALNNANLVLPVSKHLMGCLRQYGIVNECIILPNVVDENIFRPRESARIEMNDTKHILTVALLHDMKGYPTLFESLAYLKRKRQDFFLHIVGDGPKRNEYIDLTERLGIRNMAIFYGTLNKMAIADLMAKCDFFVLASLFETFGVVLIEALASGVPVIASNIGGPREIVNGTNGLLVEPDSVPKLAKGIEYMLDHYHDYDPFVLSVSSLKRYSISAIGKRLNDLYEEVFQKYKRKD